MTKGKRLYIIEAALEYFVTIVVGGAYLAKITSAIGMSQGLTGILTSFISLGALFQIFALFFSGIKRPKKLIVTISSVSYLLFACLYLIPSVAVSTIFKHVVFILFLFVGFALYNLSHAPKIGWAMSFVHETERGVFTAKKEAVSLISGIVFSYLVSFVIDHYESINRLDVAFIISAISIFVITVGHSLSLILMQDREIPTISSEKISFSKTLKLILTNRSVLKVFVVAMLSNIVHCSIVGFFGTYAISEQVDNGLGYSMLFISVVSMVACLLRAFVSRPCGKIADRYSFKVLCMFCYGIYAIAFIFAMFMSPNNSKVFYVIFYALQALANAGTNSGIINLLYEEVLPEQRMSAYAVQQAGAGVLGFLSAILSGLFVDYVHTKGGTLGGFYAQQWLSMLGVILTLFIVCFVFFFMRKKNN